MSLYAVTIPILAPWPAGIATLSAADSAATTCAQLLHDSRSGAGGWLRIASTLAKYSSRLGRLRSIIRFVIDSNLEVII